MKSKEVEVSLLEKFFGRMLHAHDSRAISVHGMPKYSVGTLVRLSGVGEAGHEGHQFFVECMFWSDILHSWVYRVPTYGFYQSESDLEVLNAASCD